jgi:hypothetical protein
MFDRFWQRYPQGSILSDLVQIHDDLYVVRVTLAAAGQPLVSTLAAADQLEMAESVARNRAMQMLGCEETAAEVLAVPAPNRLPGELAVTTLELKNQASPMVAETALPLVVNSSEPGVLSQEMDAMLAVASQVLPVPDLPSVESIPAISNEDPLLPLESEPLALTNGSVVAPLIEMGMPVETAKLIEEPVLEAPASNPPAKSRSKKAAATPPLPLPETTPEPATHEAPLSVTDIIPLINMELKRLNWSREQGRDYMVSLYNKRASSLLSDEELFGLLQHLRDETGTDALVDRPEN